MESIPVYGEAKNEEKKLDETDTSISDGAYAYNIQRLSDHNVFVSDVEDNNTFIGSRILRRMLMFVNFDSLIDINYGDPITRDSRTLLT